MKPYEDLGVSRDATSDDIEAAYMRRRSETHPDKGGDPSDFNDVQKGYEILIDPASRKYFDEHGEAEPSMNGLTPMVFISNSVASIVEKLDSVNTRNILTMVRSIVEGVREKLIAESLAHKSSIIKYESAIKRTTRSTGDNFITDMLERKILSAESAIVEIEKGFQFADVVTALLAEFEYRVDEPEPEPRGFYANFRVGGTTTGSRFP